MLYQLLTLCFLSNYYHKSTDKHSCYSSYFVIEKNGIDNLSQVVWPVKVANGLVLTTIAE